MPTDASTPNNGATHPQGRSLLSPLVASLSGSADDRHTSDDAVVTAMVTAEVALVRAWGELGLAPADVVAEVESTFGWESAGAWCTAPGIAAMEIEAGVAQGGNPVIPLIPAMRERLSAEAAAWIHRSVTSQDILDTALMMLAVDEARACAAALDRVDGSLTAFATDNRDTVAIARTLTQHAVPTTMGLRASTWVHGVRRARSRLLQAADTVPAQCGGAAGTLAASVAVASAHGVKDPVELASRLPAVFAAHVGLAAPAATWHTTRWPVTELGDALVQAVDAVGKFAGDVALLTRPEIAEVTVGDAGGSSSMPQKRNPMAAVLIRSAAMRAPHLGATLHTAAALAVDERPDGAWHAEWPALRELSTLAAGATAAAAELAVGLAVNEAGVARNLEAARGLALAERLSATLTPLIGGERFAALIAEAMTGEDLGGLVRALPEATDLDVDSLLDPATYTGLAGLWVDNLSRPSQAKP